MSTIIITAVITMVLCTAGFVTFGQTFSEWWRQKKTQKKYLRKQLAALEALKSTLEEGYEEAEEGIDSEEIEIMLANKQAEEYITSLGKVKPVFQKNYDIRSIYTCAKANLDIAEEDLAAFSKSPWLTADELSTIQHQLGMVKGDQEQCIRNLGLLITDGKITMDDGDRWEMIEGLEEHVEIVGRWLIDKISETNVLIEERVQQAANDKFLKRNLQ